MNRYGRYEITGYMPSHKAFSLSTDFTPEQITELTGVKPKNPKNGKVKHQWEFYAKFYVGEDFTEITLPCSIWDYYDSRWSAWGPALVFREMGLLPPKIEEPEDDD